MNTNLLAEGGDILDDLFTVIMDLICQITAAWTFMLLPLNCPKDMNGTINFLDF